MFSLDRVGWYVNFYHFGRFTSHTKISQGASNLVQFVKKKKIQLTLFKYRCLDMQVFRLGGNFTNQRLTDYICFFLFNRTCEPFLHSPTLKWSNTILGYYVTDKHFDGINKTLNFLLLLIFYCLLLFFYN